MSTKGFTVTEVVISALIFSIAAAGMFATVSALRQPAAESADEVAAAFLGKRILDDLRAELDATTWDSGNFSVGTHPMAPVVIDGITFTPSYDVIADPAGTGARKVTLDITW